jgi:uncharacterized protein YegP (UPF0339 family)
MHFELFQERPAGLLNNEVREWYARFVDNGVVIATTGDGYVSKVDARHAIGLMAATNTDTPVAVRVLGLSMYQFDSRGLRFEIYPQLPQGKALLSTLSHPYRWRLLHSNGNNIAHGNRAFEDEAGCYREIALLKAAGPSTEVRDDHGTGLLVSQLRALGR